MNDGIVSGLRGVAATALGWLGTRADLDGLGRRTADASAPLRVERRRAWRTATVVALWTMGAALLSAADVRDDVSAASSQTDGARQVARLTVQGLFPVQPPFLPSGPQVVLYADGTVLVPDPALPTVAPQVWPYRSGRVEAARVDALLARARTLGLLSSPARYPSSDPRQRPVSHPSQTIVVLTTSSGTFRHVADGLSAADTDARRVALRTFAGELSALVDRARTEPYQPTRIGIVAASVAPERARATVDWPSARIDLAAATACTVVGDRDTIAFLRARPAGTNYRQGGRLYRLAARLILPGDDC